MKRKILTAFRHGWRCKNALAGVFTKQKLRCIVIAWMLLLCISCGSTQTKAPDELDSAIREASDYLNGRVAGGSKAVFLNITSNYPDLSEYILSILSENAVNDGVFSVVDRQQLDAIRAELNFQWSGEVSDASAQEIGQMLGAQTIVSGTVSKIGSLYRLQVKAIAVQSAAVQGQWSKNIPDGGMTMSALTQTTGSSASASYGSGSRTGTATSGTTTSGGNAAATTTTTTTVYKIGDTGPAGGIVFYDKGNNSGGWRYLEAAPLDIMPKRVPIPGSSYIFNGLQEKAVGWGKRNTAEIMRVANNSGGGFEWAGRLAATYVLNGYDDWFLPCLDELKWMRGNLHLNGLGGFFNDWYITSTTWERSQTEFTYVHFSDGREDYWGGNRYEAYTRPIRQF